MLTEVDTRQMGSQSVSLYMDTDAQVYLVCVEGHAPITCLSRDRALMAYKHPWVYMPLEGHRIDSNGLGGGSAGKESFQGITEATAAVLIELKETLSAMSDTDFHWTVSILSEITLQMSRERGISRPYDHGEEDIAF